MRVLRAVLVVPLTLALGSCAVLSSWTGEDQPPSPGGLAGERTVALVAAASVATKRCAVRLDRRRLKSLVGLALQQEDVAAALGDRAAMQDAVVAVERTYDAQGLGPACQDAWATIGPEGAGLIAKR